MFKVGDVVRATVMGEWNGSEIGVLELPVSDLRQNEDNKVWYVRWIAGTGFTGLPIWTHRLERHLTHANLDSTQVAMLMLGTLD